MPRIRKDIWKLPQGDRTLEWYGKAVSALKNRPLTDPTSWWSLGAIHGIDQQLWQDFGFLQPGAALPESSIQAKLWNQCQHQTWYFLPWHRGYLVAFENIIRDALSKLEDGPADWNDWALPYWNYSEGGQALELPRAFADPKLADGTDNPLFVQRRYGIGQVPQAQRPIVLRPPWVAIRETLSELFYEGSADGGSTGFGGVASAFNHGTGPFGVLESQPHGNVHVFVGGGFKGSDMSEDPHDWGLMSNPDTAALDPIFWIHHSNIDRLWNVWLRQTPPRGAQPDQFKNPTDETWLGGPADRDFAMPKPDGSLYGYVPGDMLDTRAPALDYVYDDEEVAAPQHNQLAARFERLGASPQLANELAGAAQMAPPKPAELIGANAAPIRLSSAGVETTVPLDTAVRQKLSATLAVNELAANSLAAAPPALPDRVYLNLENIRSPSDAAAFDVYVNLPKDANPDDHPELRAGTVSMFGARKASDPNGPRVGNGLTASLNITEIVDRLHKDDAFTGELSVKIVSTVPGAASDKISIDRISVYRQGQ